MLIKYEIREVPVKGNGLVALEFVPKGTVVWRMTPENAIVFTTPEQYFEYIKDKTPDEKEHFYYHAFTSGNRLIKLLDDTENTNHDDNPNLISDHENNCTVALRDIFPGEELTENYLNFTVLPWWEKILADNGAMNDEALAEHFRKISEEAAGTRKASETNSQSTSGSVN